MVALLMYQPFKALYLGAALAGLLVMLPVWTLIATIPSRRPRRSWTIARTVTVWSIRYLLPVVFRTRTFSPFMMDPNEMAKVPTSGLVWVDPEPDLIVGEIKAYAEKQGVQAVRLAGYWYGQRDAQGAVGTMAEPGERVIYELHGGGWMMGNASPKSSTGAMCNDFLAKFGGSGFTRCFQIEYRKSQAPPLPPRNPFPAAIIDVVMGYKYLLQELGFEPANILVTGESAGGNLVIALGLFLKNHPSLPMPGAMLSISPSVDWGRTHYGPGSCFESNDGSDYIQPFLGDLAPRALLGNMPISEATTNPWISPASRRSDDVSGLFAGFPPTCVHVGGGELSLDESRTLYERLVADIGKEKATFLVTPNARHVSMHWGGHPRELRATYAMLAEWLETVFP